MIIGLPGETEQDFLDAAQLISGWPLNNIKFHQLQLIKGTTMAREYMQKPEDFIQYSMEDYLTLMVRIVERLNPEIVIERIAGEVTPGMGIREGWGVRYDVVLRTFEQMLEQHDTWQGKQYKSSE
jgi:radical SAM superfamily enzyme